jgi:hypothetical protein
MLFGRAFAAHRITTPLARIHSLRTVIFVFQAVADLLEVNISHRKHEHQLTSAALSVVGATRRGKNHRVRAKHFVDEISHAFYLAGLAPGLTWRLGEGRDEKKFAVRKRRLCCADRGKCRERGRHGHQSRTPGACASRYLDRLLRQRRRRLWSLSAGATLSLIRTGPFGRDRWRQRLARHGRRWLRLSVQSRQRLGQLGRLRVRRLRFYGSARTPRRSCGSISWHRKREFCRGGRRPDRIFDHAANPRLHKRRLEFD